MNPASTMRCTLSGVNPEVIVGLSPCNELPPCEKLCRGSVSPDEGDPARKPNPTGVDCPEAELPASVMDAMSCVTDGWIHRAQTLLRKLKNLVVGFVDTTCTTQGRALPDCDITKENFQVSYTRCFTDNQNMHICIHFGIL
jgi:hypothetical protein